MVYVYNPEYFDVIVNEANTKKNDEEAPSFVMEDILCKESTKKAAENAEKGYRKIPLATAKLSKASENLADIANISAYVSSFKKTNKNGKLNITAKITECAEGKGDVGFVAAIPVKGYVCGIGHDVDIEPLKIVLKYVDKFEFNGENYTQIVYIVGRASKKITNLLGSISIDTTVITRDDNVTTYTTEVNFQNETVSQETRVVSTEQGPDAVTKAKEAGKDFTLMANTIVEPFAKEFTTKNRNNKGHRNFNNNNGDRYDRARGFTGELVIPEYQGKDREKNPRRNKKRHK